MAGAADCPPRWRTWLSQGGITSHSENDTFSVIMSGGLDSKLQPYPNVDQGSEVRYYGTDNLDTKVNEPSRDTKAMMLNYKNKQPVRLFRSSNLESKYANAQGSGTIVCIWLLALKPWIRRKKHGSAIVSNLCAATEKTLFALKASRSGRQKKDLTGKKMTRRTAAGR
jgi:hypothetical protein